MTIAQKVSDLLKLRSQIDEMKKAIEPLQAQRDELQANIIVSMKKQKMLSFRGEEATVAQKITRTMSIVNEDELVADLKKKKLTDYVKERVDSNLWRTFSNEAVKQGLELKGTIIKESEYLSVTKSKRKGENE